MDKIRYIIILVITFVLLSCQHDVEEVEDIDLLPTSTITGDWRIHAYINKSLIYGPFMLKTYQETASETDSMVLKDSAKDFWNFQIKVAANFAKEKFETQKSICKISNYDIGIKIFNGKIINSDSIYFEIQFEDDETPYGTTYQLCGHRVN